METTQIFEPAFRMAGAPRSGSQNRSGMFCKGRLLAGLGKASLVILDRLKLYRIPCILSAECILDDEAQTLQ